MKETVSKKSYLNAAIAFVGLIAAILTIYAFLFQGTQNKIQYEIISNSNVFDINTNISKLDIIYDSTSLKKNNQNLRIISLRIKNVGNTNILKTFYDQNSPLGVQITNGYIVENPEILNTSNDYLSKNVRTFKKDNNLVVFSEVILDMNEFYEIKMLVLHESDKTPKLSAVGKVAGIKYIPIINSSDIEVNVPFLSKAFSGNIFIHLARSLVYFIGVTILILASVGISELISSQKNKRRKRKLIRSFEESIGYTSQRIHEVIFDNFEDYGMRILEKKYSLLTDEDEINARMEQWKEVLQLKNEKEKVIKGRIDVTDLQLSDGSRVSNRDEGKIQLIEEMKSEGFLIQTNSHLSVNDELKLTLERFIEHLKKNKFSEPVDASEFYEIKDELIRENRINN